MTDFSMCISTYHLLQMPEPPVDVVEQGMQIAPKTASKFLQRLSIATLGNIQDGPPKLSLPPTPEDLKRMQEEEEARAAAEAAEDQARKEARRSQWSFETQLVSAIC